ncbi:MAG: hypothetical protein WBB01_18520 [Phormidesmis sp.]
MKQRLMRNALLIMASVSMAAIPVEAFAHQVQTDYILNGQASSPVDSETGSRVGGSLSLRTTFSNGQPLKGATVIVYSPDQPDRVWTKGVTDSQGRYTFVPDRSISGEWKVDIQREGHADILKVPVTGEGIEIDLMAQVDNQDVHFAGSPLAAVGSIAIAAACIGFGRFTRKRSAG